MSATPAKRLRILDLDGSITCQRELISRYSPEIIDMRDLEPSARLWSNTKTEREIARRLEGTDDNCVTLYGSGDFHHLTNILIKRHRESISLIVFDFHPDWDIVLPQRACGSWVTDTLKFKNVLKIFLIGMGSSDISSFWVQTGNLDALKDGRVRIYPYRHPSSITFLRNVPENPSVKIEKFLCFQKLNWREIAGSDLSGFFHENVIRALGGGNVYISIDKDCLKKEYAATNWEEGMLSLDELLLMLKMIKDNADIAAADITGDYSSPYAGGLVKRAVSYFDHPKNYSAKGLSPEAIQATNERTNLALLKTLHPI